MAQDTKGALIVVGSGPGIGRNVAARFASGGFSKVILMSRNVERLEQDRRFVLSAAPDATVHIVPVDLGETAELQHAFAAVDGVLASCGVECVLFNAARLGASPMLEWPAEGLEKDLKVCLCFPCAI